MKWGQSFRIRHITTGRYLCLDEEKGLLVVDPERANTKQSAFCFRISKVRNERCNCPLSSPSPLVVALLFLHTSFFNSLRVPDTVLLRAGEGGCGSEA